MRQQGFTLLELMITISILVLGVVPLISVMAMGLTASQSVEGKVQALTLSQERVEDLKSGAWADVKDDAKDPLLAPFSDYSIQVDVTPDGGNPRSVTVTAFWIYQGKEQNLTLSTILTQW